MPVIQKARATVKTILLKPIKECVLKFVFICQTVYTQLTLFVWRTRNLFHEVVMR